jgi:hypothetical protein
MHLDMLDTTARQHNAIVCGTWAETREEPPPLMNIIFNAVWASPLSIESNGGHAVAHAQYALDFDLTQHACVETSHIPHPRPFIRYQIPVLPLLTLVVSLPSGTVCPKPESKSPNSPNPIQEIRIRGTSGLYQSLAFFMCEHESNQSPSS